MVKNYKVKDKNVRTIAYGDSSKPVVIGLHGLGGSAMTFLEISHYLKEYYLVCIDLPGHGKSDDLDTDFKPAYISDWLQDVIKLITKESFYLLAHSWGATVALHYCALHGRNVKKLLLLDGGYHDSEYGYKYFTTLYKEGKLSYKPFSSLDDEKAYYLKDFDDWKFDGFDQAVQAELDNHERSNENIRLMIEDLVIKEGNVFRWHARGKTAIKALEMQYESQETIEFEKIQTQTLLLYPDHPDVYLNCRENQIKLFKKRFEVSVKQYQNCGHMMHYDQPSKLVEDIKTYFI